MTALESVATRLSDARPVASSQSQLIPSRPSGTVSHGAGFWLVGYAFAVVMAFAALPTPLYVLYAQQDHLSSLVVTVVFSAYAVGVVASLFLVGHVSDWFGRRRMLLVAVGVSLVAGAVFILWTDLAALLVARVLSGLSVGIVTTTATAHIGELYARHRPDTSPRRPQMVAVAANLGGIGLGPLLSGLLAAFAPAPLRTPYVVAEGLLLIALIALVITPETVWRDTSARYRVQRVAVPAQVRGTFAAAAMGAAVTFAVFGLFSALVPSFLAGTLHQQSHAVAGAVASVVFLASAAAQLARGGDPQVTRTIGAVTVAAGLAMLTVATWTAVLPLFVVGAVATGVGGGLVFRTLLAIVLRIAPPQSRGEVLATFFFAGYVGLALPVVVLGGLAGVLSTQVLMTVFAAVAVATLAASVLVLSRTKHLQARGTAA
jgi:MFS family permease